MKYGFVNVAAAVPMVKVADVEYNVQQVESIIAQAEGRGVEVIVFPELCLTGYTCQDLFTAVARSCGRSSAHAARLHAQARYCFNCRYSHHNQWVTI